MTATSTIFKYINRDEITHLVLFQNIIKELKKENTDIFTNVLEEEFRDMILICHLIIYGVLEQGINIQIKELLMVLILM